MGWYLTFYTMAYLYMELRSSAIQTNMIAKCCTFLCSCTFMISHSRRGWPRLINDSWRDVGQLIISQISDHVAEFCPVDPCKLTSAVEVHLITTAWLLAALVNQFTNKTDEKLQVIKAIILYTIFQNTLKTFKYVAESLFCGSLWNTG